MSHLNPQQSAARTIGLPFLTVGSMAGSGANFDPGTNPTPGDTSGTDCAAAIQAAFNAAVASPYSASRPATVQFLPGVYRLWNSGTTPVPILIQSGVQNIVGPGLGAIELVPEQGSQETITLPSSGNAWSNPTGHSIYVTISGGTVSSISTTGLVQYGLAAGTSGTYLLGPDDTITVTYSAAPTATYALSVFQWNVAPGGTNQGPTISGMYHTQNGVVWQHFWDFVANPNGSGNSGSTNAAYTEGPIYGVFSHCGGVGTAFNGVDFMSDGMENCVWVACRGAHSNVMVAGGTKCIGGMHSNVLFDGGENVSHVACSHDNNTITFYGTSTTSPTGGPGTLDDALNITLYDNNMDGSGTVPRFINNNATNDTNLTIIGGFYKLPAGTISPAAWFSGNESTSYITIEGVPSFLKATNNPTPLAASPLAGLSVNGGVGVFGAQTLAEFFANQFMVAAATQWSMGQASPLVVGATVAKAETGTADTDVLTVIPVSAVHTYRLKFTCEVSSATSGVIEFTLDYTDSTSTARTPHPSFFQGGTAAPATSYTTSSSTIYWGEITFTTDDSGTSIVVKWVGGGTTAANVTAVIERIA